MTTGLFHTGNPVLRRSATEARKAVQARKRVKVAQIKRNQRLARQARAVELHEMGNTTHQIAELMKLDPATVRRYLREGLTHPAD